MSDTKYKPYDDLRLYPGIHLSEERKRELDGDAIEPDELSPEDIIYKLGRMVTGTMYSLLEMVEERWGKEAARETAVEWGRRRARINLAGWMKSRGVTSLTPELWARFQDYRHIISGPLHAPSYIEYSGENDLVLNRKACLFHDGRPEGYGQLLRPRLRRHVRRLRGGEPGLRGRHACVHVARDVRLPLRGPFHHTPVRNMGRARR